MTDRTAPPGRFRILAIAQGWDGDAGGSHRSAATMVRMLSDSGADIVLAGSDASECLIAPGGTDIAAILRGGGLRQKIRDYVALLRQIRRCDMAIVFNDLPRPVYLLSQMRLPVIFFRQDSLLTCPGQNRFLPRSGCLCERRPGWACLRVDRVEGCMGGISRRRKLGRVVKRLADRLGIRLFRNFACNSAANLRRHERTGTIFHPPCPEPTPSLRTQGGREIAFVGRLIAYKGARDAVEVLGRSAAASRLHIIGDGPDRDAVAALARDRGLEARVAFHGWLSPDARDEVLRRCGALLVCSRWDEAFGRVGPEAFALGLPVVAYRVGGIAEWCRPPAGRLVAAGDTATMAREVDALIGDRDAWNSASHAALSLAAEFGETRLRRHWLNHVSRLSGGKFLPVPSGDGPATGKRTDPARPV